MSNQRLLFFGMPGPLATTALTHFIQAGISIMAVVIPDRMPHAPPITALAHANSRQIQVSTHQKPLDLVSYTQQLGIPVLKLSNPRHPEALALLASYTAHLGCVACWPKRLPKTLLQLFQQGCVNIHPSLLPNFRGPEPIFWQLRAGVELGVSLHQMDASYDTGPLIAQAAVPTPDDADLATLEQHCAAVGAELLVAQLAQHRSQSLPSTPQIAGGSQQSFPTYADFDLQPTLTARQVFRFMRGAAAYGEHFRWLYADQTVRLVEALNFDQASSLTVPEFIGDIVRFPCVEGVVTARWTR
jgi:methionyl-tRNA formyltransferase